MRHSPQDFFGECLLPLLCSRQSGAGSWFKGETYILFCWSWGGGRLRIKFYRLTVAFNFSSLLLVIDPEIMSTMSLLS